MSETEDINEMRLMLVHLSVERQRLLSKVWNLTEERDALQRKVERLTFHHSLFCEGIDKEIEKLQIERDRYKKVAEHYEGVVNEEQS